MVQVLHKLSSTGTAYELFPGLGRGRNHDALARSESPDGVQRYCVLRRLPPPYAEHAELVEMFLDDAQIAARLRHRNLEVVHDLGLLGGVYFVAAEYLHGEPAAELLNSARPHRRPLSIAGVLSLVAGAAAGLHHVHELAASDGRPLDLVYGEVAPWNLLVGYDGAVQLVDFGEARLERRASELVSGAGVLRGKITHLSPEQCRGEPVDRRSDLFMLGMTMWDLLTGEHLFRRTTEYGILRAILHDAAPPPSTVRPNLPRGLDALVLRLLAKAPDERFQRADELLVQLEAVAAGAGISLSAAAVSQLLLERFDRRPEPWRGPPPLDGASGRSS